MAQLNVQIDDKLDKEARKKAKANYRQLSEIVREFIIKWVKGEIEL